MVYARQCSPAKMKVTPEVNMRIFLFLAPKPQPQSTRATAITAPATKKNHADLTTASEKKGREEGNDKSERVHCSNMENSKCLVRVSIQSGVALQR